MIGEYLAPKFGFIPYFPNLHSNDNKNTSHPRGSRVDLSGRWLSDPLLFPDRTEHADQPWLYRLTHIYRNIYDDRAWQTEYRVRHFLWSYRRRAHIHRSIAAKALRTAARAIKKASRTKSTRLFSTD